LEADLGQRLSEEDLKDEAKFRALEPELLNRLTVDIFDGTGSKAAAEADIGGGAIEGANTVGAKGGGVAAAQGEARTAEEGTDRGGGTGIEGTAQGVAAREEARTVGGGAEAHRGEGGDIVAGEVEVTFVDFRLLYADGNDKYASAQRGDNYYIFNFVTS
jgi:hypothetical protein